MRPGEFRRYLAEQQERAALVGLNGTYSDGSTMP